MFNNIKFPYLNLQQLNLDWLLDTVKDILKFIPKDGNVGDVLQRNSDGAAWMPISAVSMDIDGLNSAPALDSADEFPLYDVSQQGNYKTTLQDIINAITYPVTSVNGQTGAVTVSVPDLYFGSLLQTLTASVDLILDASNDCVIIEQNIHLAVSSDKKIIRLCGMMKYAPGSNSGWRTFKITGADIATPASPYVHCDFTADMYQNITPAKQIILSPSGSFVNYRVMPNKDIYLYVFVASEMISSGDDFVITFNGIPIQIAP